MEERPECGLLCLYHNYIEKIVLLTSVKLCLVWVRLALLPISNRACLLGQREMWDMNKVSFHYSAHPPLYFVLKIWQFYPLRLSLIETPLFKYYTIYYVHPFQNETVSYTCFWYSLHDFFSPGILSAAISDLLANRFQIKPFWMLCCSNMSYFSARICFTILNGFNTYERWQRALGTKVLLLTIFLKLLLRED